MKRVILLFLGAIVSFFFLSYIDEYESLIAPYLGGGSGYTSLFEPEIDEKGVETFLYSFNDSLREHYLASGPLNVTDLPASEEVKKAIYDEILFFRNRDRVMDLRLMELSILKVDKLSPFIFNVRAREKSEVRYGSTGKILTSATYTEKEYEIIYRLVAVAVGFEVAGIEVMPMETLAKQADR